MTGPPTTVLLTRPIAGSEAFAELLRARLDPEVGILISPVLKIEPVMVDINEVDADWLIATSAHAFEGVSDPEALQGRPVHCVGARTAECASALGLDVQGCYADVAGLIDAVRSKKLAGRALYLRGRHVTADLAKELSDATRKVVSRVTYDQVAQPLTPKAQSLISGPATVLLPLFSPRSARIVCAQIDGPTPGLKPLAMSASVADAWTGTAEIAGIAAHPAAESMVTLLAEHTSG